MCPIFQVSNVTGENLDLLKMFLNLLSTRLKSETTAPAEFQIDDTFSVPVCIKKNSPIMQIMQIKFENHCCFFPRKNSVSSDVVRFISVMYTIHVHVYSFLL